MFQKQIAVMTRRTARLSVQPFLHSAVACRKKNKKRQNKCKGRWHLFMGQPHHRGAEIWHAFSRDYTVLIAPTRLSTIGMNHTCLCLPSRRWYPLTDLSSDAASNVQQRPATLSVTRLSRAKTAERIEVPLGVETLVDPSHVVSDGCPNAFTARAEAERRSFRPF